MLDLRYFKRENGRLVAFQGMSMQGDRTEPKEQSVTPEPEKAPKKPHESLAQIKETLKDELKPFNSHPTTRNVMDKLPQER